MIEPSARSEGSIITAHPPPTPIPEFGPSPKVQAPIAELRALEKQFPEPTWEEVRSGWEWLYTQFGSPAMEPYLGQAIWSQLQIGIDYQCLPWPSGFTPPPGRTAGWNFTFRMARLLQPVAGLSNG